MSEIKSHPVGHGNHNNIHYILRSPYFKFKLCGFPDINKIFIMSSNTKIDKRLIDKEFLISEMRTELLSKWDLVLVGDSSELFDLRFENTKELLSSDYYEQQLVNI